MDYSPSKKPEDRILVKFEHVQTAYLMDLHSTTGEPRKIPKLTEAHVYEEKMKKMNVKKAFQVLSGTTADGIDRLAGKFNDILVKLQKKMILPPLW